MSAVLPLAELLQNAGVSSFELSKRILNKAVTIFREHDQYSKNSTEPVNFSAVNVQKSKNFPHTALKQCIESFSSTLKDVEREKYIALGSLALKNVCIPYLRILSSLACNSQDSVAAATTMNAVGTLLGVLVKVGDITLVKEIFHSFEKLILCNLKLEESCDQSEELTERNELNTYVVISTLQYILEAATVHNIEENECSLSPIFDALLNLLQHCDAPTCFLISGTPLPLLVSNKERAERVWHLITAVYMNKLTVECKSHDVIFTLLCSLHAVFIFYVSSSPFINAPCYSSLSGLNNPLFDVRSKRTFWDIIQMGLVSSDALTRKKCMYLVNCVLCSVQNGTDGSIVSDGHVFWWDKESMEDLQGVWNDLILVLETMEEKQIHIVRPVRSHLQNVMRATRVAINEYSLLHISWLMVVLSRVFVHYEAKSIIRWGVMECLNMPLGDSPLLNREHWNFIFGPLLQVLNESVLYSGREQGVSRDTCPPVVQSLIHFLKSFIEQLHPQEQGGFLSQLLSSCDSVKLADIPLFFTTYALSQLPPMPLLCSEGLSAIRSILLNGILTHKPSLRSAIQCFLLTTTCNMTNPAGVSFLDAILTLGSFRETECLIFGSSQWKQASYFFSDYCTKQPGSVTPASDVLPRQPLLDYLLECIENCIKGKVDLSQPSPAHLARALLLALHSECEGPSSGIKSGLLPTSERSLEESLTRLLAPVMDLITTAQNRAYLSQDTVHSALHLLLSLIRGFMSGSNDDKEWNGRCSSTGATLYQCLLPWLPDAMIYVQGLLLEGSKKDSLQHFDRVWFYRDVVHQLFLFMKMFGFSFHETRELGLPHIASRALGNLTAATASSSANKVIVLSPSFLGAVSALDWVVSLLSHEEHHGGNKKREDEEPDRYCSQMFSPEQIKNLVVPISSLPLLIKIVKPDVVVSSQPNQLPVVAEKKPLDWGPLIAHCYSSYWNCVLFAMRCIHRQPSLSDIYLESKSTELIVGSCVVVRVADACLESLDVATENLSTVIECLSILAPKLLSLNPQSFVNYVDTVWPLILEQKHDHKSFRRALKSFLNLVFSPVFLKEGQTCSRAVEELQYKYAGEFFTLGEARTGIYNLLTTHVCDTWMQVLSSSHTDNEQLEALFSSLRANSRLVLQACLFGPVHKKNLRAVEEVEVFIESLGDLCSANRQKTRYLEDDNSVRVYMNVFLMQLATACTAAESSVRLRVLYNEFLDMFVTLLLDELANISAERPKYYINSHTHRVKLRLLQALLLALHWIGQDVAQLMAERLLQALQFDNQLSVRYLLEWILVLVFTQRSDLLDKLFYPFLNSDKEKRLSRTCSIFTIAAHVGCSLKTPAEQMTYYFKVFLAVYQWTASHHFIARLYSQQAVFKMWDALISGHSPVAEQFSMFETCISFMKQNGDGKKFSHKLDDNFFFSKMVPCKDVNIETIFHVLPYLCHVAAEELVTLRHFQAAGRASWNKGIPLKLECDNPWLLKAVQHKMSESAQQQPEDTGSSTRSIAYHLKSSTSNEAVAGPSSGDVQKKLTPWSSNPAGFIPELFPESSSLDQLSVPHTMDGKVGERDGYTSGLILVASLLSKTPNLGGLCRTSQIFGLSEVVISNKKVLEETQFQSLSVTAEKWLTVTEVKLPALRDYLLDMQRKGYALVGVEQTAHSKCVTQYKFKHKTLLLLGNEREGIPVELIHLFQDCVEIPQFGTIRSLNVHVSGAIVIWEYTKQHLIDCGLTPS